MRKLIRLLPAVAILTGAMVFVAPRASQAQCPVEPDYALGIFQEGVLRGEVMRVDGDDSNYVEHWVLYPDYVYPSARNRVATQILPGIKRYAGLEDFFARVPFEKGARYVKVICEDGTVLPNGRAGVDPPQPDKGAKS
jgi:hypothetical protein